MHKARTIDSMQSFAIVLIITFLAMWSSLWGKWWIFLLDFVLSDGWNFIRGENFWNFIMKLFWWIFGYEIATKSIIFSIHVLSGYLGILLSKKIGEEFNLEKKYQKVWLSFFWALFFVMNPFAYERMLTQPMVYAGIIMIWYGIYYIFFREKFLFAWISFWLAFGIFPHASFMILLILFLALIFYRKPLHIWKFLSLTILPILLINSNWLTSVTFWNIKNTIDSFSSDNFMAFTTQALSPFNTIFTNLLLYWFWWEQYDNHFVKANEMSPYWYIAGIILFLSWG